MTQPGWYLLHPPSIKVAGPVVIIIFGEALRASAYFFYLAIIFFVTPYPSVSYDAPPFPRAAVLCSDT
jgi:hypothetical protein